MDYHVKAVRFNKEYLKETPRKQWLEEHKHLTGIDLEKEYDKVVPPKEKATDKKEA